MQSTVVKKILGGILVCVLTTITAQTARAQFYSETPPVLPTSPAVQQKLTLPASPSVQQFPIEYLPAEPTIIQSPPPAAPIYHSALPAPPDVPVTPNYELQKKPYNNPIDLSTDQGIEAGLQISDYRYQEHLVADTEFMHQTGIKGGITLDGAAAFKYGIFVTADFRFAFGKNDYWSEPTGNVNKIATDFIGEGRLLVGKDVLLGGGSHPYPYFDLSPYMGIGYRYLNNNPTGVTASNGGEFYRRTSEYFYLPAGITERFRVSEEARLSINTEGDFLLGGQQDTYLNDVSQALPNVVNDQGKGFGARGSIMYERRSWSVGPFLAYWNIDQSKPTTFSCFPDLCSLTEPHNQTLDYGAQARYRF